MTSTVASTRTPVVVLGMHRSGTSLTARLLESLGWYLGRPDELLGPRADNPDGFFERADVQMFNDQVLDQMSASWDAPPKPVEVREFFDDTTERNLSALIACLQSDAQGAPFALKDPRLCVLWPLWERKLPPSVTLVLAFRHPLEVATSLERRDGLPVVTGLALWERYVRAALAAAEDRAAVVVRYGDLMTDPEAGVARFAEALGVGVPNDVASAIRRELYRNRDLSQLGALTPSQRDLWSWIEQAPTTFERINAADVPGQASESSKELLESRRDSVRLRGELESLRTSFAESCEELKRREVRESVLESELERTRDELIVAAQQGSELPAARREAERAASQRDENMRELEAAVAEIAVLRNRVQAEEVLRAGQEAEIARSSARVGQLLKERELEGEHVEALRQRRLEQSRRIDTLEETIRDAEALLEGTRAELAGAIAEKDWLARVAESKQEVLRFERRNLLRALAVVEDQRRTHEAAIIAMQGSRTWRWGRNLAAALRPAAMRGKAK